MQQPQQGGPDIDAINLNMEIKAMFLRGLDLNLVSLDCVQTADL